MKVINSGKAKVEKDWSNAAFHSKSCQLLESLDIVYD